MRRSALLPACLTLLGLAPGCSLYQGDDGDDVCAYPGGGGDVGGVIAPVRLRNPETGQCEDFSTGYPNPPCDPSCGPCPPYEEPVRVPSWGLCESGCTGLDESSCLDAPGCRAIYGDALDALPYLACWATDMNGPIQGGGCDGLDAYQCSRHSDCIAVHQTSCDGGGEPTPGAVPPACEPQRFARCQAEPSDTPDPGACYGDVLCRADPPECPEGSTPGILDGCYTGYCIPLEECESMPACSSISVEASCVARSDCTPLYEGVDCTCDDTGCVCAEWLFASCE